MLKGSLIFSIRPHYLQKKRSIVKLKGRRKKGPAEGIAGTKILAFLPIDAIDRRTGGIDYGSSL